MAPAPRLVDVTAKGAIAVAEARLTAAEVARQNAQLLRAAARDLDDVRVGLARSHQQVERARIDAAREQQRVTRG